MSEARRTPPITPEDEQKYLVLVQGEIDRLDSESRTQFLRHRAFRTAVIVLGLAVPVLASISAVPRVVIGAAGAAAAVAEGVAQLYQFHSHAVNALNTRNALERELNRFLMGAAHYSGPGQRTVSHFADRVEDIREIADHASLDAWRKSTAPATAAQKCPDPVAGKNH